MVRRSSTKSNPNDPDWSPASDRPDFQSGPTHALAKPNRKEIHLELLTLRPALAGALTSANCSAFPPVQCKGDGVDRRRCAFGGSVRVRRGDTSVAPSTTSTTTATVVPSTSPEADAPLQLLVLGDSIAISEMGCGDCVGFDELFASHIEGVVGPTG